MRNPIEKKIANYRNRIHICSLSLWLEWRMAEEFLGSFAFPLTNSHVACFFPLCLPAMRIIECSSIIPSTIIAIDNQRANSRFRFYWFPSTTKVIRNSLEFVLCFVRIVRVRCRLHKWMDCAFKMWIIPCRNARIVFHEEFSLSVYHLRSFKQDRTIGVSESERKSEVHTNRSKLANMYW